VRHVEGTFEGASGADIYWQGWLPEREPKAKLVVCHGVSEHGGRYRYLVQKLVPAGWGVWVNDHLGHGRSEGKRANIQRVGYLVADTDTMLDLVTGEEPSGRPLMLGHSMGGCIAIAYAFLHQDKLRALALSSPAASVKAASRAERITARALSAVVPNLGIYPVNAEGVSRDPAEVEEYVSDPLNYHRKLPIRTVAELAGEIDEFELRAGELTLPLLVMLGTGDPLVPNEGGRMVYEGASSADKKLIEYEGFFHELINEPEPDRNRVLDDLLAWLDDHAGA
jgi:alpha-beta hydrolase superfamily lysophospholipase